MCVVSVWKIIFWLLQLSKWSNKQSHQQNIEVRECVINTTKYDCWIPFGAPLKCVII